MEIRKRSSSLDDIGSAFNKPPSFASSTSEFNSNSSNSHINNHKASSTQARRLYTAANKSLSVARELAALDFLVGIPLEAEGEIVREGWQKERRIEKEVKTDDSDISEQGFPEDTLTSLQGKWWEKWIKDDPAHSSPDQSKAMADRDNAELERPEAGDRHVDTKATSASVWQAYAPGRRLEGDDAILVRIPVTTKTLTKQRTIARVAALREWESQTASGIADGTRNNPPLADGRLFFSAAGAYPVGVFSLIRYEPRKEEQQLRRQKLEALGGGGTQFVAPSRDWRGVSYRCLLPRKRQNHSNFFDRFRSEESDQGFIEKFKRESSEGADDDISTSSSSSDDWDDYSPDLLDDPEMKLGRHRNVIIGDRALGPMVSSTIQFVKPSILKAELNKQFRERFDGWEPPRGARKYIGARVINGDLKLMDPTMEFEEETGSSSRRKRQESVASTNSVTSGKDTATTTAASTSKEMVLRMPPSLTLSKIRSLKHQALLAAVKAKLEIGTLALACVYFEKLCLDCRVDKSNRRLTFAVCMLLAVKLNEPNVGIFRKQENADPVEGHDADKAPAYLVGLNERSKNMFESLLGFFTQDWNLSLKRIFDAEWGVFAALGFSLHARPSHVAFHFKRMMKTLEWNVRDYLGREMHDQWQRVLDTEDDRLRDRERRRERKRREREQRILNLRIEIENEVIRRKTEERSEGKKTTTPSDDIPQAPVSPEAAYEEGRKKAVDRVKSGGIRLLNRMRRVKSSGKIAEQGSMVHSEHTGTRRRGSGLPGVHVSPSSPVLMSLVVDPVPSPQPTGHGDTVAIDIPKIQTEDASLGSLTMEGDDDLALVV